MVDVTLKYFFFESLVRQAYASFRKRFTDWQANRMDLTFRVFWPRGLSEIGDSFRSCVLRQLSAEFFCFSENFLGPGQSFDAFDTLDLILGNEIGDNLGQIPDFSFVVFFHDGLEVD